MPRLSNPFLSEVGTFVFDLDVIGVDFCEALSLRVVQWSPALATAGRESPLCKETRGGYPGTTLWGRGYDRWRTRVRQMEEEMTLGAAQWGSVRRILPLFGVLSSFCRTPPVNTGPVRLNAWTFWRRGAPT